MWFFLFCFLGKVLKYFVKLVFKGSGFRNIGGNRFTKSSSSKVSGGGVFRFSGEKGALGIFGIGIPEKLY